MDTVGNRNCLFIFAIIAATCFNNDHVIRHAVIGEWLITNRFLFGFFYDSISNFELLYSLEKGAIYSINPFHINWELLTKYDQFSSVAQFCLTLCDPMDCSTPGLPVHHQLLELTQTQVHQVSDAIQPSHLLSLLLQPSIFPSIRVFSSESVLCIRLPKYWSFSFSISPSNEFSGLISFRINWLDLLAVQETLKSLLQYHS